jgi:hypothetical protein
MVVVHVYWIEGETMAKKEKKKKEQLQTMDKISIQNKKTGQYKPHYKRRGELYVLSIFLDVSQIKNWLMHTIVK